MKQNKIIYYWASNELNNNGEGNLARNFLYLIKSNFKDHKLKPLNKFKDMNQNTLFYKYILPIWAALVLWKYYILGKKISYINFLPAWNFILILILPPKTIIGPVTGSHKRVKFNFVIKYLTIIGIKILKIRHKKILFSHDFFSKYLNSSKEYFYNFLLYRFKINNSSNFKKYDLIFYIKNHKNKMNDFSLKLIKELSDKYKICVIGEKIISKKNVFNMGFVSKKKALSLIRLSKAAVSPPENLFSFFLLDCISYKLIVFYNKDYRANKNIMTDLLIPIDYNNYRKSLKIIKKINFKKKRERIFLKLNVFNNYLKDL